MPPAKRPPAADSAKHRTPKKPRTATQPTVTASSADLEPQPALGDNLRQSTARPKDRDDDESDLEEAVFGRRTGHRDTAVYDLALEDLVGGRNKRARAGSDFLDEVDYDDEDDDEETGLERMRDDSVRPLPPSRLPVGSPPHALTLALPLRAALLRRRPAHGQHLGLARPGPRPLGLGLVRRGRLGLGRRRARRPRAQAQGARDAQPAPGGVARPGRRDAPDQPPGAEAPAQAARLGRRGRRERARV